MIQHPIRRRAGTPTILMAPFCLLACLWVGPSWSTQAAPAPPLPALGATAGVSVSGLSSGAFMAVQYQIAHAHHVQGAGIMAGGPYGCAENNLSRALTHCMAPTPTTPPPDAQYQWNIVTQLAQQGKIDAPEALLSHRVWLFSGANDRIVQRPVMDALADFYRARLPAAAIRYVQHAEAGHAMPALAADAANTCATSASPYLNRCEPFDAAGELLTHVLGPLQPPSPQPDGQLLRFDQRPYPAGKALDASLADEGFLYVPTACHTSECRIHVAFHGCQQSAEALGMRFVTAAGYNAWADANRLVVLYPQIRAYNGRLPGSKRELINPKGCWDWWGYTGPHYATRDGAQIRAVATMVEQLRQPANRH